MKSLVPWICLFAATTSYKAIAENEFNAYRLGNYTNATEPLLTKTGKDAVADYYLGRMYLYGYGQSRDEEQAVRYFTKSADKGYLPALQFMAKYSLMHDKHPEDSVVWYQKAASQGDVDAQLFLAAAYLYGFGVKQNVDKATHYFIDAAKSGNAIAQYALAENFIDSRHSSNNKLGLIWLSKSAKNGNPKALTKLGILSLQGKLVSKDTDKGEDLLTEAARQNYAPAMIALGNYYLKDDSINEGLDWLNKAAALKNADAYLQLAYAYLDNKSSIYDPKQGFYWMHKAADADLLTAQKELADLYDKGIGTEEDRDLANKWDRIAARQVKEMPRLSAREQVALWLSNGASDHLEDTKYQMDGILSAWNNSDTWRDSTNNNPPKIEIVTRQSIFKPNFSLTQPNDIPITSYYSALTNKDYLLPENQWTYPQYPLNAQFESLERVNSMVLAKQNLPAPYLDANYYGTEAEEQKTELMDLWTEGWEKKVNYSSAFNQMYSRAILGDPQSQFEIGQMFQYGIGVGQNEQAAIIFYQNAAEQQHLGAEYNLGILYLEHAKEPADYQTAMNWLTDSAFKGNRNAQYVLARVLDVGKEDEDGKALIKPNHEQAISMLYLSSSNGLGQAQYELADYLAHEGTQGLATKMRQKKLALIRDLYTKASDSGVVQAALPLAYYNAMSVDAHRQKLAFRAAEELANNGDDKASLLLGMLYDRGVGIEKDPAKAIFWYQQASDNPVSAFILGTYTTEGKGVAKNQDKGMDLLIQSANAQFPYAYFNLAVIEHDADKSFLPDLMKSYELGNNNAGIVLADYYLAESTQNSDSETLRKAQKIYIGLAEKGDPVAQLKLAYMLENGLGVAVDKAAAKKWYIASAEQGNPLSQYLLGQFYQVGELGDPDYSVAIDWYRKAAKQLPMASVALGFIYETVDDNYSKALSAYQAAADEGNSYGKYNLGLMYQYGKGIPVDRDKARDLLNAAADKGDEQARQALQQMDLSQKGKVSFLKSQDVQSASR